MFFVEQLVSIVCGMRSHCTSLSNRIWIGTSNSNRLSKLRRSLSTTLTQLHANITIRFLNLFICFSSKDINSSSTCYRLLQNLMPVLVERQSLDYTVHGVEPGLAASCMACVVTVQVVMWHTSDAGIDTQQLHQSLIHHSCIQLHCSTSATVYRYVYYLAHKIYTLSVF